MTFFETGEYIKQLFRIKICKGGATVQAGIEFGIEAYPDDELEPCYAFLHLFSILS
jgi:hypothetical protein